VEHPFHFLHCLAKIVAALVVSYVCITALIELLDSKVKVGQVCEPRVSKTRILNIFFT
jgi:hypothetical protein